ncbi:beta-glucosidase [Phenylobacterium sp.]|uniref:beta-glucosidase family protein n=1 Tax=Phenylobacterium sp. TaxID=1871053 RepID=UPI002DE4EE7B|nr:beta-glucosidase [Phenylobacterium sp.]
MFSRSFAAAGLAVLAAGAVHAAPKAKAAPDARADALIAQMTLDEQIALVHGVMPALMNPMPAGTIRSAGYIPGLPRLHIPDLKESDASLGVANAGRSHDDAVALPSGLSLAATFSEPTAQAGGAMIGKEARQKGFNVLLAGGVDLVREPRNGRNFEYLGEDPLLAGRMAAASIRGIQSQHMVSTSKHFAINDQETGRMIASVELPEAAQRESDLLAFELALEGGKPGSVMCAYNKVGGTYACEHPHLLNDILKGDWGYPGWVMSDWGAVHSVDAANQGLDQESGQQLDKQVFFAAPLKAAVESGQVSRARLHDMVHRIVREMIAKGLIDPPDPGQLDTAKDSVVALHAAEQGIVLLKNEHGLLPLAASAKRIVVIGGHADVGVISGGGSSQVIPLNSVHFAPPKGAPPWGQGIWFHGSAPLKALQAAAPGAQIAFDPGTDPAAAAAAAKDADVAIVFATHWVSEAYDARDLTLPDNQDALIAAVAAANPRTVVVLESGVPNLMPWLDQVGAVVEAWYPGSRGGEAIANVLTGKTPPSGRLPITFPAALAQLPEPALPGADLPNETTPFDIAYAEGSDVGYRWFASRGAKPLFPFGYGLSYSAFHYSGLKVVGGRTVTASFTVTNTGARAAIDTPQLYLKTEPRRAQQRLIGWSRVTLKPGESRTVTLAADPRLLASWADHGWRIDPGAYALFVGSDAMTPVLSGSAKIAGSRLRP